MSRSRRGHWRKYDNCLKEAMKYGSRKGFKQGSRGAYVASIKMGWLDAVCSHMIPCDNGFNIYAYAIEFPVLKSVYVGITINAHRRKRQHLDCSSNKYVKELLGNGCEYKWVDLSEVSNRLKAKDFENSIIYRYKDNGWNILNIKKAGALGGSRKKWTKIRCRQEALKYDSKKKFYQNSYLAYCAAQTSGWLKELCLHMTSLKKSNGYWSEKENCVNAAHTCETLSQFRKRFSRAYSMSYKNGWIGKEIVFTDRKIKSGDIVKKMFYWTNDMCKKEALKYTNRTDFQKNSKSAYAAAQRNGWLNEMYLHMEVLVMPLGYYTIEICKEVAKKYITRSEFAFGSPGAYNRAKKNGWLDIVCVHMVSALGLKKKVA